MHPKTGHKKDSIGTPITHCVPYNFVSFLHMQDAVHSQVLIQGIEPGTQQSPNKTHGNENEQVPYRPQVTTFALIRVTLKKIVLFRYCMTL